MNDNLIPGDIPKISGHPKSAKNNSSIKQGKKQTKDIKWFKKKTTGHFFAILAEIGFICWVWTEFHKCHEFPEMIFFLACLVSLYLAASFSILKVTENIFIVCVIFGSLLLVTGFTAFVNSKPLPKPHIVFGISKSENPGKIFWLTNSSFRPHVNLMSEFRTNSNPLGKIIIPFSPSNRWVNLSFSVANISSTEPLEKLRIDAWLPPQKFNIKLKGLENWRPIIPVINDMEQISWTMPEPSIIYPMGGLMLPTISFDITSVPAIKFPGESDRVLFMPFGFGAKAKGVDTTGVMFLIEFIPVTNDTDLFLIPGVSQ